MNNEIQELIIKKVNHFVARYRKLCILTSAPEIIAHNSYLRKLLKEQESLFELNENYNFIELSEKEIRHLTDELCAASGDFKNLIEAEIAELRSKINVAYLKLTQLLGQQKTADARLELFVRDGGANCLETLANMYISYAKRRGCTTEMTDSSASKYIKLRIPNLYYDLVSECGIHHIVRNTAKKNAKILILVFEDKLQEDHRILDSDIRIDLFHSGGAGGQNVNKVESAIRATHLPTGISVVCQDERSQLQNREKAMIALQAKVQSFFSHRRESADAEIRKKALFAALHTQVRTYDFVACKVTELSTNLVFDLEETLGGALDEILSINKLN